MYGQSELALFQIKRLLRPRVKQQNIEPVAGLGSVTDPDRLRLVLVERGVDIVIHATAYKHVQFVEANELEGARNNVLGTHVAAESAIAQGCERFVLVSTDKAVRPTNITGAIKLMAELVVQDLQTRTTGTRLSMVRFGNVLGSSESGLPLFQQQILTGGPVTITHPDVTRFFISIPEAARLVLLAAAYSTGGDIFVLDMGEP